LISEGLHGVQDAWNDAAAREENLEATLEVAAFKRQLEGLEAKARQALGLYVDIRVDIAQKFGG
jgi:hypothetical protein